jgi:hypothetical protein
MGKKLAVLLPGGSGIMIPLLYFAGDKFDQEGYDIKFIANPASEGRSVDINIIYDNARERMLKLLAEGYEDIVLVGKSLGSVTAGKLNDELKLNAQLILLTPIKGTFPYIRRGNRIRLVAAGETDGLIDIDSLTSLCQREEVPYYIEPCVGHSMDLTGNLERNLEIIRNVVSKY